MPHIAIRDNTGKIRGQGGDPGLAQHADRPRGQLGNFLASNACTALRCSAVKQTGESRRLGDSPIPKELKALLIADLSFLELAVDLSHVGDASLTNSFDLALLLLRSTGAFSECRRVDD